MLQSFRSKRAPPANPGSHEEFEAKLRESGAAYHIHHPFNRMLNEGRATREQIRGWVANRYYYQISIPIKDAAILSNCPSRAMRREWIQRILDHDGYGDDAGGIEAWTQLALAVGPHARGARRPALRVAGRAFRGRCVRQLRAPRAVAGSNVLVADGAVLHRKFTRNGCDLARALSVDRDDGSPVLP